MTYLEQAEQQELFRQQATDGNKQIFDSRGSAGNNSEKLARILVTLDLINAVFGWSNKTDENGKATEAKPLLSLPNILTQYQASVDTKYHNDYKDILIAQEIERKRSERKGISVLQS